MMINDLKNKIDVLAITDTGNVYEWAAIAQIWAKVEHLNSNNIFTSTGIGAKSIKFTIRKRELTLNNAFRWQGKHCFLTNIIETDDRMYYEVTAAIIEPKTCIAEQTGEPTLNELNRPVYGNPTTLTFPGILIEKNLGHMQEKPMATIEIRYFLVTPKGIELDIGDLVVINNVTYNAELLHALDEYKNQYEIAVRSDA